jgi:hypothetical protein
MANAIGLSGWYTQSCQRCNSILVYHGGTINGLGNWKDTSADDEVSPSFTMRSVLKEH